MKKIVFLLVFLVFYSCSTKDKTVVKIQPATESVNTVDGANLDLELVGQLAMQCKDSEELEKKLNDPATKLNNLDLDGDGNVDWITVTDGPTDNPNARLMSLSVQFSENDIEEIATIEIDKTSDSGGEVYLVGSESVYGSGAHYRSGFSFTDALLFHYMFTPRYRPYYSPYYAYRPPVYYSPYRSVPVTTYRTTTRTARRTSTSSSTFSKSNTTRQSKVTSPNKGKTSQKATANRAVKSKTQSQKSMNKASTSQKNKLNSGKSAFKNTNSSSKSSVNKSTPKKKTTKSRTSRTSRSKRRH